MNSPTVSQLGGLDERFFMYCEDGDFCWRARQAGWKTMLVPQGQVTHLGGASAPSTAGRIHGRIGIYVLQSRYLYTCKYWGLAAVRCLRTANWVAGCIFRLASWLHPNPARRAQLVSHGTLLCQTAVPVIQKQPWEAG